MKIHGIHYNWHQHPSVGEVYHHYYVGGKYEAPDWEHSATVTYIEKGPENYVVSFDNGVDIIVTNINKLFVIPNDFYQKEGNSSGGGGRTDQDE